ncbi:HAMP domain-containing protein [Streptomyces sp. SID2888]|nr:HAMP domain-containing protein [Streptomyces sp. SID2888]
MASLRLLHSRHPELFNAFIVGSSREVNTSGGGFYVALAGGSSPPDTGPVLPDPLPPAGSIVTEGRGSGRPFIHYRLLVDRVPGGPTLVLALDLEKSTQALSLARKTVAVIQILSLALVGLLSVSVVRRELGPLERAANMADAIAAGDLDRRLRDDGAPSPVPGTEVGRLADALDGMLDKIQEAFRARDASEGRLRQFVADASHELRTPLQSVRGYGELYRAGALPDSESVDEAMGRMLSEVARMTKLVESLLLLARFDQSEEPEFEPVDLGRVVMDSCRDARAVEPDRPFDEHVAQGLTVFGDEAQLRRLVANLLGNVRMHTPVAAACTVVLEDFEGETILRVIDQGPGIPAAALPHVFDRFYRADRSRARATGGTGLGLALTAAIVETHGGRVSLDCPPGGGTHVEVRIPKLRNTSR